MGTNYDFIELYNMAGNRFFGGVFLPGGGKAASGQTEGER